MALAYFCSQIWRGTLARKFSKHFTYLTSLLTVGGLLILGGVAARTLRIRSLPSPKVASNAETRSRGKLWQQYGSLPLSFEPNEGQADHQVKFLSRGKGYSLLLTETEAVLQLPKVNPQVAASSSSYSLSRSRTTADREFVNVGYEVVGSESSIRDQRSKSSAWEEQLLSWQRPAEEIGRAHV